MKVIHNRTTVSRARSSRVVTRAAPIGGGGLLERNVVGNFKFAYEPYYRVILIYSNWVDDKDVAQKVHHSINVLGYNEALRVVRNAHTEGKAIVVTVIKDDAVLYMSNMKNKGLDVVLDEA